MRVKAVPDPPADLGTVREARRAIPRVPGTETDCCRRLQERLDLPARDAARTWLTFLRGVGVARSVAHGFVRTDVPVDRDTLAEGLLEGVLGARELVEATEDGPVGPEAALDALAHAVPRWERARHQDWRAVWSDRAVALLGWLELAGLVDPTPDGHVRP